MFPSYFSCPFHFKKQNKNISISKFSYAANMFIIPELPFYVPKPIATCFSIRDHCPAGSTLNWKIFITTKNVLEYSLLETLELRIIQNTS